MKRFICISILLTIVNVLFAGKNQVDNQLEKISQFTAADQIIRILNQLSAVPENIVLIENFAKERLEQSITTGNVKQQEKFLFILCYTNFPRGDYPALLAHGLTGLRISKALGDKIYQSLFLERIGLAFELEKDEKRASSYCRMAFTPAYLSRDTDIMIHICSNLSSGYILLKRPDSALFFARYQYQLINRESDTSRKLHNLAVAFECLGEAHAALNQLDSALFFYRRAMSLSGRYIPGDSPILKKNIAEIYLKVGLTDSAKKYALETYQTSLTVKRYDWAAVAAGMLSKLLEGKDDSKSLFYLKAEMAAKDSLNEGEKNKDFQIVANKEQQREEELKNAAFAYQAKIRFYGLIIILSVVIVMAAVVWTAYKKKQKANKLLESQKAQIEEALSKLKTMQQQLIQSEKMASLGELTAGIAHEIQNPLNFINNFSDLNEELLQELELELQSGDIANALSVINDVQQNEQIIRRHGRRADSIVKSMLEHSHNRSGRKEPTDINELAEKYMRLSYQGLKIKEKPLNAVPMVPIAMGMTTSFDPALPMVNVVPQDMSRVLLNLFNNAFYAVKQMQKVAGPAYKPEVLVSTHLENGKVIIKVKDNGTGIPAAIKDKIMQPFFTTKPTGEGTGLGLSLTFDIVVKGHGGEIFVDSEEGKYTEFKISIPIV